MILQNNPSNKNNPKEDSASVSTINNINRERVRQRLTSYKYNIYSRKNIVLNFRISIDYLDKIDFIVERLRARSLSDALRQSIDIVYGLLSGLEKVESGSIIIQNPIVNINRVEAKAENRTEIDVKGAITEIAKLVEKLYNYRDTMYPLQKKLVEQLYRKIERMVMKN